MDRLDQLPERASLIFRYDAAVAITAPDNAEVLAAPKTRQVIAAFAQQVDSDPSPMTPERFKSIMNEVKAKTGAKGKDLFHPVRIALTGSHSGPEFDKLIPILEEGSQLDLPQHVLNTHERLAAFRAAGGPASAGNRAGFLLRPPRLLPPEGARRFAASYDPGGRYSTAFLPPRRQNARRVERGQRRIRVVDQQRNLRATEHHRIAAVVLQPPITCWKYFAIHSRTRRSPVRP